MFGSFFSGIFKAIGSLDGSGSACWKFIIDEPEMPKSMIEK